ncbi:MAG: RnfABCDGE type electron transport complex subunit D [Clostridia bacterium]|nr:RnfABCDGE type electron transport complex subunit D [Clostridia bacterium]
MKKLVISSSPHIHSGASTRRVMLDVLIALLPASVAAVWLFGLRALLILVTTTATAVLAELVFCLLAKKDRTIGDLSAAVTGLLLGLNLPLTATVWQCVVGTLFAIIVVKCLFGGLGCNFANPAITARIFLFLSFSGTLAGSVIPTKFESFKEFLNVGPSVELVTGATPLAIMQSGKGALPTVLEMLLGQRGGSIGETCGIAILIGFVYLLIRRVISWHTPVIFVGTVFVLSMIITADPYYALMQVLSGGLLLGAVFMATDYVTTPITRGGKCLFALGCGVITVLIRFYGSYPEGVSFAILFMNILTPYIEKWTGRKPLGGAKA